MHYTLHKHKTVNGKCRSSKTSEDRIDKVCGRCDIRHTGKPDEYGVSDMIQQHGNDSNELYVLSCQAGCLDLSDGSSIWTHRRSIAQNETQETPNEI